MAPAETPAEFVRANTRLRPVPYVPEIQLHLADEAIGLWERTCREPPPFWAFAWAGGQALARYVLDHPAVVAGRRVLDLGSGSGLVAVAAARAGGADVAVSEIDHLATTAIGVNAVANGVPRPTQVGDVLDGYDSAVDLVLAGDVFYDHDMAARVVSFFHRLPRGVEVLVGDPGRKYLPCRGLERLAVYDVPACRSLEDADVKRTVVWRYRR